MFLFFTPCQSRKFWHLLKDGAYLSAEGVEGNSPLPFCLAVTSLHWPPNRVEITLSCGYPCILITGPPAYSETSWSDTPATVTVLAIPKQFVNKNPMIEVTKCAY